MAVKSQPDGYHAITPYLIVPGAAKLIDFVKQAFGAAEIERLNGPDGAIMHAEVRIGDSVVMMGESSERNPAMTGSLYLYVSDTDATYKRALEAGATSVMEPADQFYGDRNAGIKDPSGNHWWIATRQENVTMDELRKRAEDAMKKRAAG